MPASCIKYLVIANIPNTVLNTWSTKVESLKYIRIILRLWYILVIYQHTGSLGGNVVCSFVCKH